jgi:TPR repeat protein
MIKRLHHYLPCLIIATHAVTPIKAFADKSSSVLEISGQSQYEEAIQRLKDGSDTDLRETFDLLMQAAKQKHPNAIGAIGYLYANGIFVEKDDIKARKYTEEAVALGSKDSRLNLGLFLIHGRGGPKDLDKGLVLLKDMALEGSNEAALSLGEIYYTGEHSETKEPDYQKAYEVLLAPAKSGLPNAQNYIGVLLKDGRLGVKDEEAARVWFEKAALQGNPKACKNLADFWNYQSESRKCRIESLRWLIVAEQLNEIVAKYEWNDIKSLVSHDEEKTARALAELTLEIIRAYR